LRYCTRCVYPAIAATPLEFDENGICSGCRIHGQKNAIDWEERKKLLADLLAEYRSSSGGNYDCIIPVSGGKDSYYQTHVIAKEFGMKPLLVTYHGNNYLPEGQWNLNRMREVFDVDHHVFSPSVDTLVKLNRICFKLMGDMNWQNHCGIFTYPVRAAVQFRIPLLIWGEHGYTDLAGMYSMNDFVEMTEKYRLEHAQRGYDWFDMTDDGMEKIGRPELKEGLKARDLLWAKYPTDEELDDVGVRGIYLFNYVPWDANRHARLVMDLYGWKPAEKPFERTYRRFSNLDDRYENGMHDYLRYVKFGYGRATDHACKDIRSGLMTRGQGIEMVRKYDHVKSSDLQYWLKYVGMTEEEFDRIADTFRDPRVWKKNARGEWIKENIWDNSDLAQI
jgi:N-acetyl sugar amidotransferase